jgi:NAD(P) transhydrogenase subunit alpha
MIVLIPKENNKSETRVSATPSSIKDLIKLGIEVHVESSAGEKSFISDEEYSKKGATIVKNPSDSFSKADIVLGVLAPELNNVKMMKKGSSIISLCQTTRELDYVNTLSQHSINGFSMHLIPRTTLAQKMDALSSQANIAGYKSVLMAANRLSVYMPLLMTAAGTIRPAKVLIIGAGVAGLQAIATAKRLGAQVEAFDVRPVVREQVESLGAKFIEVESESDDGVGEGGYAKETSDEYKEKQQQLMHKHLQSADIVITTALIPGRPAPLLITKSMVETMKPGSVIMDLASENGGNCELTKKDEITEIHQITIDGTSNIPGTMPVHASELYSKNILAFLTYLIKDKKLTLDLEDEIISGALFTTDGKVTDKPTLKALKGK